MDADSAQIGGRAGAAPGARAARAGLAAAPVLFLLLFLIYPLARILALGLSPAAGTVLGALRQAAGDTDLGAVLLSSARPGAAVHRAHPRRGSARCLDIRQVSIPRQGASPGAAHDSLCPADRRGGLGIRGADRLGRPAGKGGRSGDGLRQHPAQPHADASGSAARPRLLQCVPRGADRRRGVVRAGPAHGRGCPGAGGWPRRLLCARHAAPPPALHRRGLDADLRLLLFELRGDPHTRRPPDLHPGDGDLSSGRLHVRSSRCGASFGSPARRDRGRDVRLFPAAGALERDPEPEAAGHHRAQAAGRGGMAARCRLRDHPHDRPDPPHGLAHPRILSHP